MEKEISINQLLEILVVLVDIWEHKHMTIPLFQEMKMQRWLRDIHAFAGMYNVLGSKLNGPSTRLTVSSIKIYVSLIHIPYNFVPFRPPSGKVVRFFIILGWLCKKVQK